MSKAKEVLNQIKECYTYKGSYYVNHQDIQKHLRNDRIDVGDYSIHKHDGFETSFDESMSVIFYSDNSALVVNSNGGLHAVG